MLHTGTLLRAELYNDYTGKSSVVTVYNANKGKYPGKLIVTNAHWYRTEPITPVGNYKVGGTVISQQYDPHSTSLERRRPAQAETTRTSIQINSIELVILIFPLN